MWVSCRAEKFVKKMSSVFFKFTFITFSFQLATWGVGGVKKSKKTPDATFKFRLESYQLDLTLMKTDEINSECMCSSKFIGLSQEA